MLANGPDNLAQFGTLSTDVQRPAAFRFELLDFISKELPRWRDRADRPSVTAETRFNISTLRSSQQRSTTLRWLGYLAIPSRRGGRAE